MAVEILRSAEHKRHKIPGAGFEFLAEDLDFDVHITTLEPGIEGTPAQHEGKEAIYILDGEMKVQIDGALYHLRKGDSAIYPSTSPHSWENPGKAETKIIVVAIPKSSIAKALGL